MGEKPELVQTLNKRDAVLAAIALVIGFGNVLLWFWAPDLLRSALGESAVPFSIGLGIFCMLMAPVLAWISVKDDDASPDETFDTSKH